MSAKLWHQLLVDVAHGCLRQLACGTSLLDRRLSPAPEMHHRTLDELAEMTAGLFQGCSARHLL